SFARFHVFMPRSDRPSGKEVARSWRMDTIALHLEIRNALELSDELRRYEHAVPDEELASRLGALETALADLERLVGRSYRAPSALDPDTVAGFERALESVLVRRASVPARLHARVHKLIATAERVSSALWDPRARVPAKPLAGVLPLARIVPQDV